jgi:hypothetical protein
MVEAKKMSNSKMCLFSVLAFVNVLLKKNNQTMVKVLQFLMGFKRDEHLATFFKIKANRSFNYSSLLT